ncbi:permease-like cell division protein FtsX [Nonomuraea wenchangensis]|uniref:permease-like cell division protein FtsX n=1 Tax=Nonomuraea wenchangensis TaxID=568860 RepID=UPI003326C970
MDELTLLRDRFHAQPAPSPEATAAALDRLMTATRARRRRVPRVVAVIAAVAVLVTAVTVLRTGDEHPQMAAAAVTGEWKKGDPELGVFLCGADSPYPSCGGGGVPEWEDGQTAPPEPVGGGKAITAEQMKILGQTLGAMPQVETVTFISQQEAFARMRRQFPDVANMAVADMPRSFTLKLTPDADRNAVIAAVRVLPGVATVVDRECIAQGIIERLLHGHVRCTT